MEKAPVKGVVLYDGKPLSEGGVQFYPVGVGPMAAGRISKDGSFELTTANPGDGALVGEHIVVVTPCTDINQAAFDRGMQGKTAVKQPDDVIPQLVRSRSTSRLKVTVESGFNEFSLDLAEIESDE